MIFKLLQLELLKVRRSLALLMMLLCPLMVTVLIFSMQLKTNKGGPIHWEMYWLGNTAIWGYFMLPLFIALATGLLNGSEHKNATWRLMLTLPITARQLFLAKFILAVLFVVGANVALFAQIALSIGVFGLLGFSTDQAFQYDFVRGFFLATVCSLPIVIVQHWISWCVQNIVAPLAVGVVATMGIMQIGQSKDWVYYPWAYVMTAVNGTAPDIAIRATTLACLVASVLLIWTTYWVGRKGTEFQ
nr:ABC transporter permease [uncultured Undibacterium sp.]